MENWFGLTKGTYFGEPPIYVNKELPAGMTSVPKATILGWIKKSPFILITSPNFIWAIIALLLYKFAPYDIQSDSLQPISYSFVTQRLQILYPLTIGYFSFWHVALYFFNMAKRPFIVNRVYNVNKVIHNIFWTSSGILIWTLFENIFCYLWATGRLSYTEDFTSVEGVVRFMAVLMGIPLWRSFHFYFAHRFLHFKPLYQQVHSLHHRNTDVEPFSGLCMHPIEHLYYFSCIAPSLIFNCSPFALLWNGIHLLLSPAASHSGYEDHFQSDSFHYLHHRYFECNYAGTDAAFFDIFFGTFKGTFSEQQPKPRDDTKSTLFAVPTKEFLTYLSASSCCIGIWYYNVLHNIPTSTSQSLAVASLVGFGPVISSVLVTYGFSWGKPAFQLNRNDLFHILIGTLFCSLPITYLCFLPFVNI
jgi:sterol desaturase/sphingolipid hydroxylase (fatty acid hydroxylase superfamily)